jgi:hypothetical protein
MPSAGFEPAGDRPQTHALDRSATGIGRFEPAAPEGDRPQTHAWDRLATGTGITNID